MTTWYLAFCVQCNGGIGALIAGDKSVLPMPFDTKARRTDWVDEHMDGTDHAVLLMNQISATPLRHSDTNDTSDGNDGKEPTVHQTQ